jgi:hypothetical protein
MSPSEVEGKMDMEDINKFKEVFDNWISTEEGKKSIEDALKKSHEIVQKVKEANQIEPELFKMHITL